jgi:putative transposase
MTKWKKLSHTIYQCKYHTVWCPKYRYRILKGTLSKSVEQTLRMLCEWRSIEILEMSVKEDHIHIHMILSMPPRLSISEVMGILKGKTAIKLFKSYPALKKKPYWGNHFWSRGYCISTIGLDETKIRKYVKYQEERERQEEGDQQEFGLF